jgi:cell division protein FtsA
MFRRKPSYKNNIIAALDIGTTKVNCAIARLSGNDQFDVIGVGQQMMRGLKRGIIIDMEAVVNAVAEAITTAERQADESIRQIYVGIPSHALLSKAYTMEIPLGQASVNAEDLEGIFHKVHEMVQKSGHEALHVFPLSFELDDQKGIMDPKGMFGNILKAHLHIVAIPTNVVRNYLACLSKAHLDVVGLVAAPYASALSTLVDDEMELGAALMDMGGGSTSIIGYMGGRPSFITNVPIGGHHITQDIARVFSTPIAHAERLKVLYGSALMLSHDERESISIPQIGEAEGSHQLTITKAQLNNVIQSRLEEILSHLKQKMQTHNGVAFYSRVVLAGGASQLTGVRDFVVQSLGKGVRMGSPALRDVVSQGADFATCSGILTYALKDSGVHAMQQQRQENQRGFVGRLANFLKDKN